MPSCIAERPPDAGVKAKRHLHVGGCLQGCLCEGEWLCATMQLHRQVMGAMPQPHSSASPGLERPLWFKSGAHVPQAWEPGTKV